MQWVQVLNKHSQTRQHLPFLQTIYKNTSALISALINALIVLVKLQTSENESTPTKNIYLATIIQGVS